MKVHRRFGLTGAAAATGAAAVIDTFRAYSTAAYLFDAGIDRLMLTSTLDGVRSLAAGIPGSVRCGEQDGRKPDDFDLGNSPGEVRERDDLAGRTIVMRTSAGTRCLRAAVEAGAEPVFAASLVVASTTARALEGRTEVSIVASGRLGTEYADEDDATADLIAALLTPSAEPDLASFAARVRSGDGARRVGTADWAHPDDVELCVAVDAFAFAMEAHTEGGIVELRPAAI